MDDNNEERDEVPEVSPQVTADRWLISSKLYPTDERQWLLATSYNTGIECLQFVSTLSLLFAISH
jgi:hypothetical protein